MIARQIVPLACAMAIATACSLIAPSEGELTGGSGAGGGSLGAAGGTDSGSDSGGSAAQSMGTGGQGSAAAAGGGGTTGGQGGGAGVATAGMASAGEATGGVETGGADGDGGTGTAGAGGSEDDTPPSCRGSLTECGTEALSCCEAAPVPSGWVWLGERGDEMRLNASVSLFYLDRFEVTVGRFRTFLESYTEWRQNGHPREDEGVHPYIEGTGWHERWNEFLPQEARALEAEVENCFSVPFPNLREAAAQNLPINCVTWFEAFAFCVWDEGRLPTEIEWQYAAAGGSEDRIYPWGDLPEPTPEHAVYGCAPPCEIPPVGSKSLGVGRWGQLDLAGSMAEWVFDGGDVYREDCYRDCANTTREDSRMFRGGSFIQDASGLRTTLRNGAIPELRNYFLGFRCARTSL